jgi:hypothetical protein
MIVTRPITANEPDLLSGYENEPLILKDLDANELTRIEPVPDGWTHDMLESLELVAFEPFDAYLGSRWVGSSEI